MIPLIGLGLIKGIMEIFCGVSIFLGMQSRKRQKNPVISFAFNKTGLLSLVEFRYRIAKDKDKVERVGAIRVAANLAALVGLLFFLL
ncbi:MAG: hypothetical protein GY943_04375 [Chloroflexi bacterium]|nr:hypothetical protein [Chloroflexota bacterium]